MEDTQVIKEKLATSVRLDADIYTAIDSLADAEGRPSRANMIEWLLKTHPRVQEATGAEVSTNGKGRESA